MKFQTRSRRTRAVALALGVSLLVGLLPAEVGARSNTVAQSPLGLGEGSTGDQVAAVQRALQAAEIVVVGGADGRFGAMTAQALREFQLSRGLAPTGAVDEATARALGLSGGTLAPSVLPLRQGATGTAVTIMQQALTGAGITVHGAADGIFGPLTTQAVSEYQVSRGMTASGVFDRPTAAALARRAASNASTPNPAPTAATEAVASVADVESTARVTADQLVGLRLGDVGPRVRSMQSALLSSGLTFLGGADGIFGPATANALRLFQSKRGLEVSGSVDSTTAAALVGSAGQTPGAAPAPTPPSTGGNSLVGLAPGTRGPLVTELQQALLNAGLRFAGGADGIFGPATANALREFQTSRGLEPTGRVDQATAAALASVPGTPTTPTPVPPPNPNPLPTPNPPSASGFPVFGEQGERVRQMQQALINAGINVPGGADGIFGTMTAGAIMTFQRQRGLEPTGVIDAATARALGLTPATAPPPPPPAADIRLEVFPVARPCSFIDTWHAPRGGGRLHEGTDIIAPEGVEIYAVTAGTITQMYYDRPGSRAGNGLRLSMADGTYFFYAHLLDFAPGIGVGTQVTAGQLLGYNGETGNAGVPHLHFEIHPGGGAAVNPFPALRAINGCR